MGQLIGGVRLIRTGRDLLRHRHDVSSLLHRAPDLLLELLGPALSLFTRHRIRRDDVHCIGVLGIELLVRPAPEHRRLPFEHEFGRLDSCWVERRVEIELFAGNQLTLQVRPVGRPYGQVFATPSDLVSSEDDSNTPDEERLAARGFAAYPQAFHFLALSIRPLVSDQEPVSGPEGPAVVNLVDGPKAVNWLYSH